MNIKDIIGNGKDFEPPLKVENGDNYYEAVVRDSTGKIISCIWCNSYRGMTIEKANEIANHICELLNREHNKQNKQNNHENQPHPLTIATPHKAWR